MVRTIRGVDIQRIFILHDPSDVLASYRTTMARIHLFGIPQSSLGTGPLQHEPALALGRQGRAALLVEPPLLSRWGCEAGLFVCCLLAVHGSSARCAGSRASVPPSTVAAMACRGHNARETAGKNRSWACSPHLKSGRKRPEYVSEGRIGAPGIAGTARKRLRGGRLDNKKHVSTRDAIGRCEAHGWPTQGTLAKRCAAEPAIPANRASRASFASKASEATALPRLQRKAPSAAAL